MNNGTLKPKSADETYRSLFPTNSIHATESVAARAYATALDIRKFEIDLYWKRAAYFWLFTGAALAGYLTALTSKDISNRGEALLVTSSIGLIFATAWYLVNRASKYWQRNWEFHVDLLEDIQSGPLYKTVLESDAQLWKLSGPYPFSVSKVNQWLSLFIAVLFVILLARTLTCHYRISSDFDWFSTLCVIGTTVAIFTMIKWARAGSSKEEVRMRRRTTTIHDQTV